MKVKKEIIYIYLNYGKRINNIKIENRYRNVDVRIYKNEKISLR